MDADKRVVLASSIVQQLVHSSALSRMQSPKADLSIWVSCSQIVYTDLTLAGLSRDGFRLVQQVPEDECDFVPGSRNERFHEFRTYIWVSLLGLSNHMSLRGVSLTFGSLFSPLTGPFALDGALNHEHGQFSWRLDCSLSCQLTSRRESLDIQTILGARFNFGPTELGKFLITVFTSLRALVDARDELTTRRVAQEVITTVTTYDQFINNLAPSSTNASQLTTSIHALYLLSQLTTVVPILASHFHLSDAHSELSRMIQAALVVLTCRLDRLPPYTGLYSSLLRKLLDFVHHHGLGKANVVPGTPYASGGNLLVKFFGDWQELHGEESALMEEVDWEEVQESLGVSLPGGKLELASEEDFRALLFDRSTVLEALEMQEQHGRTIEEGDRKMEVLESPQVSLQRGRRERGDGAREEELGALEGELEAAEVAQATIELSWKLTREVAERCALNQLAAVPEEEVAGESLSSLSPTAGSFDAKLLHFAAILDAISTGEFATLITSLPTLLRANRVDVRRQSRLRSSHPHHLLHRPFDVRSHRPHQHRPSSSFAFSSSHGRRRRRRRRRRFFLNPVSSAQRFHGRAVGAGLLGPSSRPRRGFQDPHQELPLLPCFSFL